MLFKPGDLAIPSEIWNITAKVSNKDIYKNSLFEILRAAINGPDEYVDVTVVASDGWAIGAELKFNVKFMQHV